MKHVLKRLILTVIIFICCIYAFNGEKILAQTMTVDDPMLDYLRFLEAGDDSLRLPSMMIEPISAERYLDKLDVSSVHPWQKHPMFIKPDQQTIDDMDYVRRSFPVPAQIHLVKDDQTVYSISRMYGITEEELMRWNNLDNTTIFIGQELFIEEPRLPEPPQKVQQPVPSDTRQIVQFYTPVTKLTYNNNVPIGQNDGALWQGRGVNTSISAGAFFSYSIVKASIRPNFIYSTNQDFTLSRWPAPKGISDFGYEFSVIDYPQRFGDEPINRIDPGQSWIRAEYQEFSAGVSTSTISIGPAIYNPITLSNNAPGFLHAFIGTHEPFQTKIGNFEGKLFWGRLEESDYFDEDNSNDLRLINGLTLIYSPDFLKELHLGISRVFVKNVPEDGLEPGDYFLAFKRMYKGPYEDTDRLQMMSLFGRWKIPHYGFEFYGEWSRNTPASDFRDLLLNPEHSRAYTLGFQKRFTLAPEHWLTLNYEMTQIERPRSVQFRFSEPFYRSNAVPQGYTHRGQILGAGIGPGSNSQKVHVRYFWPFGLFGASFNRIVHDNTRLYENYKIIGERSWGIRNPRIVNEVEFRYGLNAIVFLLRRVELQVDLYRTKYFHHEHGILGFENPTLYNTNLQFTLRYQFENFLR